MKVNLHPKEGLLFNAFLIMFVTHAVQTGVGIVGLPRIVFLEAKHDGWISVIFAGFMVAIVLWFMFLMLKQYDSADLYGIQVDVFGKWIGNVMNFIYMIYLSACFFVILMNYIEIVQVWIFTDLPTWQISIVLILLTLYGVQGGTRIVVGIAFFSVLGTAWMILILFVPIKYSDPTHLFPIWNTETMKILKGAYRSSLSMIGFELIMFLYPYIKEKKKALFFAQLGNLYTTFLYTVVTIVSITFFAEISLSRTIWPVLSMFKIVRLPNLERFEFIAVSFWMLVILPNMCGYLWAASKGFTRVLNWKQNKGIWIIAIIIWGATFFVKARYQMNELTDVIGKAGFYFAFCYPVVLSIIVLIKKWFVRRKQARAETS